MRRVKEVVDLALGAAILTALLLVVTGAPTWLALLGPLGVAVSVLDHFTTDTDTDDTPGDDS